MILSRRTLLAGLAASGTGLPAFAQSAPEPQLVPIELVEDTLALPSAVRLGHKHGEEHGFGLKGEDGGREKSGGEQGAVFGKMWHAAMITLD